MILAVAAPGGADWVLHAWAMASAAVTAAACGLVGTLLVVRRMSLFGDALTTPCCPASWSPRSRAAGPAEPSCSRGRSSRPSSRSG